MTVDYLARALVQVMMILADVAESGIDSHTALNALESIGEELDQMGSEDRREFDEVLDRIASSGHPEQAEWIRNIPRALGMSQA